MFFISNNESPKMNTNLLLFRFNSLKTFSSFRLDISYTISNMASLAGDSDKILKQAPGLLAILKNNPKRLERIRFLGQLFENKGYELRIAGGAVRDILRGVEPLDIDLATTARPEQSLSILDKHQDIMRIIVTASGQKHGTVAVKFKEAQIDSKRIKLEHDKEFIPKSDDEPKYDEESPYEITTLRCDNITDGRHAEVEFVNDWRIDAERRDLTINAMFLTLNDGKLIDYFQGETDLKNGTVRFVGDADRRIKEDYLRILRFFRFWSRYGRGKQPDEETKQTIRDNLEGLEIISGERLWQEIKKILSHIPCIDVVNLMLELKVFKHLGVVDDNIDDYSKYFEEVLERFKDVEKNVDSYSTTILDDKLNTESNNKSWKKIKDLLPTIIFSSIIQSSEMCLSAHMRMKFSNIEKDSILYIIENREHEQDIKTLKYQLAMSNQPDVLPHVLHKVKTLLIYKGRFDLIEQLEGWTVPTFPMTGHGVAKEVRKRKLPGERIKDILASLKETWASSEYQMNREELEKVMKSKLDEL